MTDQLSIYNAALRLTGSRRLASLSEDVKSRYILDDIWDDGGIDACLEYGWWNHAARTVQIDYSPSITPSFGYRYAFDKPTDLIKLISLTDDEYFNSPLRNVQDEGNYWFADLQTIYVRYVSNDADYGLDFSKWPQSFSDFVAAYFANEAIKSLTDATSDAKEVRDAFNNARRLAKANDALKEPTTFTVPTGWQAARGSFYRGRRIPYR